MKQFSDIHYTILGLLSTCGWVSLPLLELLDYGYTYRTRALKTLLDGQYIRKSGKGRAKAYAISAKGRNLLAAYNTKRFGGEAKGMAKQLARHPERSVQRGDAAAFLSFGGFSVHPDDKPAFPAYTPDPSGEDWRGLYRNTESHRYPDQPDSGVYWRRTTAVNCYYDATAIKELAVDAAGVGYSRACGVLLTPSYLLRVYHSRDVAMKFHSTGEQNFQCLLLSPKIFTGYLPEEQNAALILGTDFTAAQHILEHHLAGHSSWMPLSAKKKGGKGYTAVKGLAGELVTPTNLGKPAFYLPLCKDSLPLLRLMAYPSWQGFLVREICRGAVPTAGSVPLVHRARWIYRLYPGHLEPGPDRPGYADGPGQFGKEGADRLPGLAGPAVPPAAGALRWTAGPLADQAPRRIFRGASPKGKRILGGSR